MKKLLIALTLLSLAVIAPTQATKATKTAIARTIETYLAKTSPGLGKMHVVNLDVQGAWALAEIQQKNVDNAKLLLRKQPKGWKVLVLGTALYGTGKIYGTPKALRKRWGI